MNNIVELKPPPFIRCLVPEAHQGSCRLSYEGRGQQFSHVFGSLEGAMIFARYAIQSPTKEWSKINVEAAFGETIDCSGSGQLLLGIDWGSVLQRSKPSVLSKLMARAVAPQSISEKYP